MKKLVVSIIATAILMGGTVFAVDHLGHGNRVLPPAYLSVPDFKLCLKTHSMGTWSAYCLPAQQPKACPLDSWKQLQGLVDVEAC